MTWTRHSHFLPVLCGAITITLCSRYKIWIWTRDVFRVVWKHQFVHKGGVYTLHSSSKLLNSWQNIFNWFSLKQTELIVLGELFAKLPLKETLWLRHYHAHYSTLSVLASFNGQDGGAGHDADSFPNRVVSKTHAREARSIRKLFYFCVKVSCWGNILQNTERQSLMTLSISTLSWSILCQTLAGSETDKKSVRDKIMTLLGFSLQMTASDWSLEPQTGLWLARSWPLILSDKLVQLGPAALTDEGKNCQSRFNFYYTLSCSSLDEINIYPV